MQSSSETAVEHNARLSCSRRPIGGAAKRVVDMVVAFAAIIALIPLLVGCCVVVLATSPGPIFFRHRRIGFEGREFGCLKFRTMVVDAERKLLEHLANDLDALHEWRSVQKLRNDPRVTPIGHFLRRTSLDELPQLFNVIMGDMSIVGPRPITPQEIKKYKEHFRGYTNARPGITGLWQVNGRTSTTYAERVAYDLEYVHNWSLVRDLRIMCVTIVRMLDGSGAY